MHIHRLFHDKTHAHTFSTWLHTSFPHCEMTFLVVHYKGSRIMKCGWLTHTWRRMISTGVRCSTKGCWPAGGLLGWLQETFQCTGLNILLWARNTLPTAHSHYPFFSHSLWAHQWVSVSHLPPNAPLLNTLKRKNSMCGMEPMHNFE